MTRNDFIATAESRETSREIMEAIWQVAGGDAKTAEALWEDGCAAYNDNREMTCIIEIVTKNGLFETTDFSWGASGENWADR